MNISKIHRTASEILDRTDKVAIDAFFREKRIEEKFDGENSLGIVTEADREIENIFRSELEKEFPAIGFLGEEKDIGELKEHNFIIDPIDGTKPFAEGVPTFSTSVALWRENTPIYINLSFPMMRRRVSAVKGEGVKINGKSFARPKSEYSDIFFAAKLSSEEKVALHKKISDFLKPPKNFSSATFHREGIISGYGVAGIFINLAVWDLAAIMLLAKESGLDLVSVGNSVDLYPENIRKYAHSIIVSEKEYTERIVRIVEKYA